jgi:hypothetical protein
MSSIMRRRNGVITSSVMGDAPVLSEWLLAPHLRLSRRWNGFGVSFSPTASDKALKTIRQTVRGWALHERSDKSLDDLARMFNANGTTPMRASEALLKQKQINKKTHS